MPFAIFPGWLKIVLQNITKNNWMQMYYLCYYFSHLINYLVQENVCFNVSFFSWKETVLFMVKVKKLRFVHSPHRHWPCSRQNSSIRRRFLVSFRPAPGTEAASLMVNSDHSLSSADPLHGSLHLIIAKELRLASHCKGKSNQCCDKISLG